MVTHPPCCVRIAVLPEAGPKEGGPLVAKEAKLRRPKSRQREDGALTSAPPRAQLQIQNITGLPSKRTLRLRRSSFTSCTSLSILLRSSSLSRSTRSLHDRISMGRSL